MEDLSLHILDVAENATAAGATRVEIRIREDTAQDLLEIAITDNGRGMTAETLRRARDPFFTTRTTRHVGLGLSLLEQSARETGGDMEMRSQPGQGTEVRVRMHPSHIDCRPLGDLGATLVTLILGNPGVVFHYSASFDGDETNIDTEEIQAELDGVAITDPEVLELIRRTAGRK